MERRITLPLTEELAKTLHAGDSVLVTGTTGEAPTLTHEEEYEILHCVKATVNGDCKVIMGAGSNCTETAICSSKKAQELGADAILSVVPYYNKPTQKGIYEHFKKIAKTFKDEKFISKSFGLGNDRYDRSFLR